MENTAPMRTAHSNPNDIAKHAIGVIEKRLREQYGLKVQMGLELEFSLYFKKDAPCLKDNATKRDPLQLGRGHSRALFPQSRFVQYSYRECEYGALFHQYEAVTDHRHPMPISQLPLAIQSLREVITNRGKGKTPPEQHPNADWQQKNIDHISFASSRDYLNTNGMHLNFSLVDATSKEPINQAERNRLFPLIMNTSEQLFYQERNLLAHTPEQKLRWNLQCSEIVRPNVHRRTPEDPYSYIENKSPCASGNPYYAILLQMAAIEDGLAQGKKGSPSPSLEAILNRLEAGLGTRFMDATKAHPELKSFETEPKKSTTTHR